MTNSQKQAIALTLTTITTLVTTYYLTKSITKYGLNGTIRLIWEGDHLPPKIREAVDKLEEVSKRIKKNQTTLDNIEIMMEVEKLNSVDDDSNGKMNNNIINIINKNDTSESTATTSTIITLSPSAKLSKQLSMLSYALDKLAADIDSVQSHNDIHVKSKKKEYSAIVVKMMETIDGFLKECGIES